MRFFLSSTYKDLVKIRTVAINFLENLVGTTTDTTGKAVAMEYFNATERTCKEECLHELDSCDLVIGIYGEKYGSIDPDTGLSMTEIEYDYAVAHNIPILAFVMRTSKREEREALFISSKIHGSGASCANFTDENDFVDRLDESLRNYIGSYDGYSYDSIWASVSSMCEDLKQKIENDVPGYDLQMMPYKAGDEDAALESILQSAVMVKKFIPDFETENSAVYDFAAHTAGLHAEQITEQAKEELAKNVNNCSDVILRNCEHIYLGLNNHTTAIILAAMYLKLKRMQERLLTERWTEPLRQKVVKAREAYLKTIKKSRYID